MNIRLAETKEEDLNLFFQFQLDEEARHIAAFTPKDSNDKAAYIERFTAFLTDPTINMRTILVGEAISGSIAKFEIGGEAQITYWIDRKFWGNGIATAALKEFLKIEQKRPIYGGAAFDNLGSQRVLEKCGFVKTGEVKDFANARQAEINEFLYQLSI